MKNIVLSLIAICSVLSLDTENDLDQKLKQKSNSIENSNLKPDSPPEERNLRIEVEELKKNSKKKVKKQKRELKTDLHDLFLKNVDDLIQEFGIDKELNYDEIDDYFKKLEDQMYGSMKKKFLSNKDYMKNYNELNDVYKKLSKKYNLK